MEHALSCETSMDMYEVLLIVMLGVYGGSQ